MDSDDAREIRRTDPRTIARAALRELPDPARIDRRLHAVPPHAVYAVTVDGVRAVCKVDAHPAGSAGLEGRLVTELGTASSLPVPPAIDVGRHHAILGWLDGVPDEPTLTPEWARAAGRGLGALHEATAGRYPGPGLLDLEEGESTVRRAGTHAEALADRLERCGEFLGRYGFDGLARHVAGELRANPHALVDPGEPVLVHGNYLLDHVGVRDGRVVAIIDFEHAMVGPAGYDLECTAVPTFLQPDRDESLLEDFLEGYRAVRPVPPRFADNRPIYRTVLGVTFLRSLYLQRDYERRAAADRRARRLADRIAASLEEW